MSELQQLQQEISEVKALLLSVLQGQNKDNGNRVSTAEPVVPAEQVPPVISVTIPQPKKKVSKKKQKSELLCIKVSAYAYTIKNRILREKFIEVLIKSGTWRTQQ